jgi:hypothetical protein
MAVQHDAELQDSEAAIEEYLLRRTYRRQRTTIEEHLLIHRVCARYYCGMHAGSTSLTVHDIEWIAQLLPRYRGSILTNGRGGRRDVKEEGRSVFADVFCLRRSHVPGKCKRDALRAWHLPSMFIRLLRPPVKSFGAQRRPKLAEGGAFWQVCLCRLSFPDVCLARAGSRRPNLAGILDLGICCQMEATVTLQSTSKHRTLLTRHGKTKSRL